MNIDKSYGDLFYTPKSLPGCFCSEILLTAKKRLFSNEILLTAKKRLFSNEILLTAKSKAFF